MDKEDVDKEDSHTHTHTHTHTVEYYSAINSEILLLVRTCMDLKMDHGWTFPLLCLSEISHAEKDKHHIISFICGI